MTSIYTTLNGWTPPTPMWVLEKIIPFPSFIHPCWWAGSRSLPTFCLIHKSWTYPSTGKNALIQPVPTKGDQSNPSNYRPIALTSTIAKVFKTLLNFHILKHIESNSDLSDHLYGFCKARSTGDHLSYLTHLWSSSLRNFGETYVVAVDISTAYDSVWYKALLPKLSSYGLTLPLC